MSECKGILLMTLTTDDENLIIQLPLGMLNDYTIEEKFPLEDVKKLLNGYIDNLSKIPGGEIEVENALDIAQWDYDSE
jgi:hypothetical protein